jgi:hypothetical protein
MIAIGVYVCVVLLYLVYEFFLDRTPFQRIFLLVCTAVFSVSAFVVAWDIAWIQYLCGIQTILEVLNLVATVNPKAFPYHILPVARTLYFTGILVCAIEHNTAGCILLFLAWLAIVGDILFHFILVELNQHIPILKQEGK